VVGERVFDAITATRACVELLNWTLQTSDNLYAEEFFKWSMLRVNSTTPFSYALGCEVMRANLPAEVAAGAYAVDGSGECRSESAPQTRVVFVRTVKTQSAVAACFARFV
jgi:hypothetical protein